MGKVENLGLNNSQGWEEEKTKGRIITKGGKKRKPRAELKIRVGIPTPVLIITRVYYSAGKNTIPNLSIIFL